MRCTHDKTVQRHVLHFDRHEARRSRILNHQSPRQPVGGQEQAGFKRLKIELAVRETHRVMKDTQTNWMTHAALENSG